MICSLASRILLVRQHQPVTTARLLCDRTVGYRATLQQHLFVPRIGSSAPIASSPATNNEIQNA
jgi:hypothetical protein